jgi:Phage integrase family
VASFRFYVDADTDGTILLDGTSKPRAITHITPLLFESCTGTRRISRFSQRRNEVGSMTWTELDRATGKWRTPGSRTKNHRDHELTLPSMAWGVIDRVPEREGYDYLFGRRHGFTGWQRKSQLDKRSGVTGWTIHDLRRTAATGMANIGIQPHIIEAVLNHVSGHKSGVAEPRYYRRHGRVISGFRRRSERARCDRSNSSRAVRDRTRSGCSGSAPEMPRWQKHGRAETHCSGAWRFPASAKSSPVYRHAQVATLG